MKFLIIFAALVAFASARGARIWKGQCVGRNDPVISDRGCFQMDIQNDGNMVVYRRTDRRVVWATGTNGKGGHHVCMQNDGNFVLYDVNNRALWATGTHRNGGHFAYLQDDGQLTIRGSNEQSVWVSGKVMNC